jgi:phenylalanyl-tRNA synthetase alpha chain
MDIWRDQGWLEVLGCGMIHPNVFKNAGMDPTTVEGFAFGLGVERFAMLKHGISDLRHFVGGDIRFSKKYGISSAHGM